jgi:glycosyltransferase involved in cell wall biosynthesis
MLTGADGLIAVSQSLADLARELAGRDLKMHVIPNGVDTENFRRFEDGQAPTKPSQAAREALGWDPGVRYVVSVGHVQRLKGWHRLIEAWPAVRQRSGDARLVLVGGGARERRYERELRRKIEMHRLIGAVRFTGRVEPDDVARMLNAADLYVQASRSEGWCNAIAEALGCGCPVVATNVGGNRELITSDALGALVELDDRNALVDAIVRGLSREWNRRQIAQAGGRRDWQQVGLECADVLRGVMSRGRRTAAGDSAARA